MTANSDQLTLIERVRALLTDEPSTREVSMFGGRAFMVNDAMIASAFANGDLLVRVDPEQDGELIHKPGAARAEMGAGRSMGPGWISVSATSIVGNEQLTFWMDVVLQHNERTGNQHRSTSGGRNA